MTSRVGGRDWDLGLDVDSLPDDLRRQLRRVLNRLASSSVSACPHPAADATVCLNDARTRLMCGRCSSRHATGRARHPCPCGSTDSVAATDLAGVTLGRAIVRPEGSARATFTGRVRLLVFCCGWCRGRVLQSQL